ncbi:hypothetical protein [Leptolyngbya sp. FACHB-17]|uniref:hypothetical protein n=1 Tax=unclassified Leptolyngbya TaxID=2650499 RepID=UPI00168052C2|nr:hypothetical protein [Leptolyngbya sp. FACHB-17]MBD2078396.1 hypothetical protein [Leptolyngbya sp. FACHB-17]
MDLIEEKVRDIETNVLDKHHEQQSLLKRSQIEAVAYLLKMYDNCVRELLTGSMQLSKDRWLYEQEFLQRALEQSLRWVLQYCSPHESFSSDSWTDIDDEAFSLMLWARSYVKLCYDHIAASRGHYTASYDEDIHEIRFQIKAINDFTILTSQMASRSFHIDNFLGSIPELELQNIFETYRIGVDFNNLDKGLSFKHDLSDSNYRTLKNWSREAILPELEDSEDLDGFTLGQARDLWTLIFIESQVLTRLEIYSDVLFGSENSFSGFNYQLLISELVDDFSQALEIDSDVVSKIINFLTFDKSSQKSSLINSFFVKLGNERISLLLWNVVSTDPNLAFSSALAKRSRRNVYETLIQRIESTNVTRIAQALQNIEYVVLKEKMLVDQTQNKICPDLMIYDPLTYQLLIADYKHAIPPFGASEVVNRLKDLDKWIKQVRRYLNFAENNKKKL